MLANVGDTHSPNLFLCVRTTCVCAQVRCSAEGCDLWGGGILVRDLESGSFNDVSTLLAEYRVEAGDQVWEQR